MRSTTRRLKFRAVDDQGSKAPIRSDVVLDDEWAVGFLCVCKGSIDLFLTAECRQIRMSGREREGSERDQSDKIRVKGGTD